jgi:hypothetical protein
MNVFERRLTESLGPRMDRRWIVLPVSLLVAAACSGSATDRSSTPASSPAAGSTSTPAPSTAPGTRVIDVQVLGGGEYPGYTVKAPTAWGALALHFVIKSGSEVIGLSVWDVGEVPRDPCHWKGTLADPGPTVDDLVEALTAQRLRHATEPTDVMLDGYRGSYLEWSVPADMVVTGDAEFDGCDIEPSSGLRDFVSWFGDGHGERYQQVAGQVDRLWILDVDGQRLVIDATYSPDTTETDRAELTTIVESIRFNDHVE